MTGCVYVPVGDADAALATLAHPVVAEWGIEHREWGAREIVLRDPDGYVVTLTEATASAHAPATMERVTGIEPA